MAPAQKKQKLSNGSVATVEAADIPHQDMHKASSAERQLRSLFVRSLPTNATSEALTDLFSESYPVKHATAVIDQSTKACRGYGFVTFVDPEDAQRAQKEFNGYSWEGRKLRIEVAEPRQRDTTKGSPDSVKPKSSRQRQQDTPRPSMLIVRNLPWTIKTPDDLAKLFMSYGKVKQAYIPKKSSGLLAGFGFVVLRGRKNAEKALNGVNGKEIDDRTLAVDWAVSKDVYEDLLKQNKEGGLDETENADGVATGSGAPESKDKNPSPHGDAEEIAADTVDVALEEESDGTGAAASDGELAEDEDEGSADEEATNAADDKSEDRSSTIFVRNLPFTCPDEDLEAHFTTFGSVRYARVVMDAVTERSRGTGFVCFYNKEDANTCLRHAPRRTISNGLGDSKDTKSKLPTSSILQNEEADPSGKYTLDGRVLQVSPAIGKAEAERLTEEGATHRRKLKDDKRRLYLLAEGTISSKSKLYEKLSPSERNMREASAKQRKTLIESNPSLHLSLTRLSIRNIPRSVGSKELKALAREAVVGFATDVKAGTRQPLSKEELARGGDEMQGAEKARKKAGKGVVKQAKVVFEGAGGSKVSEDSGAGRSRGYGFIEYYTHRSTLMGLRWLNGHAIGYTVKDNSKPKAGKEEVQDRKKRLIVEFAIENAQVVMRRHDNEQKARDRSLAVGSGLAQDGQGELGKVEDGRGKAQQPRKRKWESDKSTASHKPKKHRPGEVPVSTSNDDHDGMGRQKKATDEKLARRNQIIGRKRAIRQARKDGKQ
jgi:nucleolar protein 4